MPEFGEEPLHAVFIRAPYIESVGTKVTVMAMFKKQIVIARQGKFLATAFHPELTNDDRVHKFTLDRKAHV